MGTRAPNLNHDVNKVSQNSDIPLKTVKENIGIFSDFLCVSFCSSTKSRKFSKNLKLPDIKPLHKKGKKVSILPNLSKICKKCIFTQMLQCFNNIFSKYQCGFRKSTAAVDSENLLTMEKLLVLY